MNQYEHILLVDKPTGMTSFDVIRELRKKLGIRKMGHAGTLDPLATGLMIIGVGPGTKQMQEFLKLPKTYIADILVGIRTDTGDTDGATLEEKQVSELSEEKVTEALDHLLGTHSYPVPLYSAIKVDGKALYKYARQGKTPPRIPEKEMTVTEYELLSIEPDTKTVLVRVSFHVTSGTYIRVLGETLGDLLGYPATLSALRRTSIGKFSVNDAHSLEEF